MYTFDAKETKNKIVEWIKMFFEQNGKDCIATVGLSGGKIQALLRLSVWKLLERIEF